MNDDHSKFVLIVTLFPIGLQLVNFFLTVLGRLHSIYFKQKECFVCLQPSRLKCIRCDAIQYYGKECRKKDWKVHKHNCKDKNSSGELHSNIIIFNKAYNYLEQDNYLRAEKCFRILLEPS